MMRALVIWILMGLALVLPAAAWAQEPVSLAYYIEVLQVVQADLEAGATEDAVGRLAAITEVSLPDGTVLDVDTASLAATIRRDPEAAQTQLETLVARLTPLHTPPDNAREQLGEVFQRPEFRERSLDWFERFLRWLDSLFSGIEVENVEAGGDLLSWVMAGLAALLMFGLLAFFLYRIRATVVARAEVALEGPEGQRYTALEARRKAAKAAQAGNLREATRLLYLTTLLLLDERGALRYDRALTNREVLAGVRDQPKVHQALSPVVQTFDQVWYGHTEPAPEEFARYQQSVDALHDLVPPEGLR